MKSSHIATRVLVSIGLALVAACPGPALASTAGVFQFVAGDVRLMPLAGSERAPRKGTPLGVGDTVATGTGGVAQIKMGDGAILVVQPESRLTVTAYSYAGKEDGSERVAYRLEHGGFRAVTGAIGRSHKSNYLIETPIAQMGVRGTDHESYYFPATGAGLAAGPLPGAYNKVNVGQTFLRTRSGEVVIGPNQVGYVASAQNRPGLLPAVPEFCNRAVAPRSARLRDGAFQIAAVAAPSAPKVEQPVSIVTAGVSGAGGINLSILPPVVGAPGTAVPGSGSVAAFVEPVGLSNLARSAVNPTITPALAVLASAGGDAAWGVNWGSWQAGVATVNGSLTVGSTHFAETKNLTSATQLAALGSGLVSATYNYLGGPAPTNQLGLAPGSIQRLSVGVNFATQSITSYSLAATVDAKQWSATGSGTIAQFSKGAGIALSGSCSACSLPVLPGGLGGPAAATGTAHGAFVGGAAERMITSFGLNSGTHAIAGVGYLGR
jgi:hypothetical protein